MLQVTTNDVRERIEAVRSLAIFNDCIRSHVLDEIDLSEIAGKLGANQYCQARQNIAPSMQWRVFSHCASVTRLYALYESFVYQLISDWITKVPVLYPSYSALPANVVIAHRVGVGQLLQKWWGGPRTEHLTELKLIDGLFRGLSSANPYTLLSDAFFIDLANLRLEELDRLFGRVGLSGLTEWLTNHTQMKQYCEGAGVTVGDRLKDLIDY